MWGQPSITRTRLEMASVLIHRVIALTSFVNIAMITGTATAPIILPYTQPTKRVRVKRKHAPMLPNPRMESIKRELRILLNFLLNKKNVLLLLTYTQTVSKFDWVIGYYFYYTSMH